MKKRKKKKEKRKKKETIKRKITTTMDINIHSKYPKFLIYILHNRQGQFSPFHSLIFLLNS